MSKTPYDLMRDTLKKYINHVRECEGIDYISDANTGNGFGGGFTEDELSILKHMEKELDNEFRSANYNLPIPR